MNTYFKNNNIDARYSIIKQPSLLYLLEITDKMEDYANSMKMIFVHEKGKRKLEFQRLYEKIADHAMKMMKYEIHYDLFQGRNSFSKKDPDVAFLHMKYNYYNHKTEMIENALFLDEIGILWLFYPVNMKKAVT